MSQPVNGPPFSPGAQPFLLEFPDPFEPPRSPLALTLTAEEDSRETRRLWDNYPINASHIISDSQRQRDFETFLWVGPNESATEADTLRSRVGDLEERLNDSSNQVSLIWESRSPFQTPLITTPGMESTMAPLSPSFLDTSAPNDGVSPDFSEPMPEIAPITQPMDTEIGDSRNRLSNSHAKRKPSQERNSNKKKQKTTEQLPAVKRTNQYWAMLNTNLSKIEGLIRSGIVLIDSDKLIYEQLAKDVAEARNLSYTDEPWQILQGSLGEFRNKISSPNYSGFPAAINPSLPVTELVITYNPPPVSIVIPCNTNQFAISEFKNKLNEKLSEIKSLVCSEKDVKKYDELAEKVRALPDDAVYTPYALLRAPYAPLRIALKLFEKELRQRSQSVSCAEKRL